MILLTSMEDGVKIIVNERYIKTVVARPRPYRGGSKIRLRGQHVFTVAEDVDKIWDMVKET